MMALRETFRQGDPRGLHDEHGGRFNLHRLPIKAMPGRMKLQRYVAVQHAMALPGIRDLFPEGIQEPARAEPRSSDCSESQSAPATASVWKSEQTRDVGVWFGAFNSDMKQWRGLGIEPRFRFAESDVRRLDAIVSKFRGEVSAALARAVVIDTQASARPTFLRLVIDNTRAEVPHGQ
jgi:hypothetical protein